MAADAAADPQTPVSAQVVGNAFVQQYYHILHHSPELVHRFYLDTSKLGRPEAEGSMSITTTMQAINEKIVSLKYGDFKAEIKSVDAQESFGGGFQVLVTGYLIGKDNAVRNFAQTFFLAPQEIGYFVLNDMFRFVDNANVNPAVVNDVVVPIIAEPIPSSVQESNASEHGSPSADEAIAGELYDPPENGDMPVVEEEAPISEVVDQVKDDSQIVVEASAKSEEVIKKSYDPPENGDMPVVEEDAPISEVVDQVKDDSQIVVESSAKSEEVIKKSYASIVMDLKESAATFSPPPSASRKAPPMNVERQTPTFTPVNNGPVSNSESATDNGNNQEGEGMISDGYSVYIKGLPMNATEALLEEVFKKFGTIKIDGIQVRSNRLQGFCFGFVEFEEASSVQKALEASPVIIGGRQAFVEEKRSTNSRGNFRGRFQTGRGSGFRNEGVRGHGNFGGGRGYSRGDFNGRSDFVYRGGNRGGSSNHDGYQRSDNSYGNRGRMNRTGGMGNVSAKNMTPQVSATA